MFGLSLQQLLGLTVFGAIISTLGSIFGTVLKDYFFSRSFETWKQQKSLEQLYQKFRDPLLLSTRELASRVVEIIDHYPTVYLRSAVFGLRPERQIENSTEDPYFQRYKLISTLYRFCSFLGWLELYRQEIAFLHPGSNVHSRKLEESIAMIRSDLADGQLNTAKNWLEWRDTLLFREELRAIGEAMIETRGATRTVIGYGRFCELVDSGTHSATKQWVAVAMNFFLDLEVARRDFGKMRLERLVVHLVDLLELIDGETMQDHLAAARAKSRLTIEAKANA